MTGGWGVSTAWTRRTKGCSLPGRTWPDGSRFRDTTQNCRQLKTSELLLFGFLWNILELPLTMHRKLRKGNHGQGRAPLLPDGSGRPRPARHGLRWATGLLNTESRATGDPADPGVTAADRGPGPGRAVRTTFVRSGLEDGRSLGVDHTSRLRGVSWEEDGTACGQLCALHGTEAAVRWLRPPGRPLPPSLKPLRGPRAGEPCRARPEGTHVRLPGQSGPHRSGSALPRVGRPGVGGAHRAAGPDVQERAAGRVGSRALTLLSPGFREGVWLVRNQRFPSTSGASSKLGAEARACGPEVTAHALRRPRLASLRGSHGPVSHPQMAAASVLPNGAVTTSSGSFARLGWSP